jgi:hypothetical protein
MYDCYVTVSYIWTPHKTYYVKFSGSISVSSYLSTDHFLTHDLQFKSITPDSQSQGPRFTTRLHKRVTTVTSTQLRPGSAVMVTHVNWDTTHGFLPLTGPWVDKNLGYWSKSKQIVRFSRVMTRCNTICSYHRFKDTYYLHLQCGIDAILEYHWYIKGVGNGSQWTEVVNCI